MHGFDTSIPQFAMHIRGTYIIVIPELVSEILHVLWVAHPNYLTYQHLRIVSKEEICLSSMRHLLHRVSAKTLHV